MVMKIVDNAQGTVLHESTFIAVPLCLIIRPRYIYSVIQKDGLNFVRLYFLNYTRYMNDLHNI